MASLICQTPKEFLYGALVPTIKDGVGVVDRLFGPCGEIPLGVILRSVFANVLEALTDILRLPDQFGAVVARHDLMITNLKATESLKKILQGLAIVPVVLSIVNFECAANSHGPDSGVRDFGPIRELDVLDNVHFFVPTG